MATIESDECKRDRAIISRTRGLMRRRAGSHLGTSNPTLGKWGSEFFRGVDGLLSSRPQACAAQQSRSGLIGPALIVIAIVVIVGIPPRARLTRIKAIKNGTG